ncbi:hypothetical protein AVEN_58505-1 [Araneus ventricosus]|uniref:Uncharacterized protein n=1 Tax=Araneus ventricosus TaxID=182803 RepID=A0A4Y2IAH5_ARAVE|nr:hypothetical protein AVEN_58505-1 [Araneus ventricosus]
MTRTIRKGRDRLGRGPLRNKTLKKGRGENDLNRDPRWSLGILNEDRAQTVEVRDTKPSTESPFLTKAFKLHPSRVVISMGNVVSNRVPKLNIWKRTDSRSE